MDGVEGKNCIGRNNDVISQDGCLKVKDRNLCKRSFYKNENGQVMACRVHNKPSKRACHYKSRKIKGKKLAKCTTLPFIITNPNDFNDQVNSLLSKTEAEVLDKKTQDNELARRIQNLRESIQKLQGTTSNPTANMTEKQFNDYVSSKIATIRSNTTNKKSGGKKKTKKNKKYRKKTRKY